MNKEITRENLMRVLPAPLDNDKGMHSLGDTTAIALTRMWDRIGLPLIYARIDELPESLIDILARDFKVDWYDYDADVQTKRTILRESFTVRRYIGTKKAVQRVVAEVFGDGRVEEWFEYDGEPYHFRVYTTNARAMQERREQFVQLVNIVKNVRSVLDGIIYYSAAESARAQLGIKAVSVAETSSAVAKNYFKGA